MTHDRKTVVLEAVIFDMDGLLLDTEAMARKSLIHAGAVFGLDADLRFCESLIGIPADDCNLLFARRFGASAPAAAYFAEATRHLAMEIDAGRMNVKPGVHALLACLTRAGIAHAVATSSSREKALHHLGKAGIAHGFDAIATRTDVARGKPFPDVYLHAARQLGVAPGACLALEDSYNGVRAAHAAGMAVVMVPDLLPPTEEMRSLCLAVVPDLHHVVRLLGSATGADALRA